MHVGHIIWIILHIYIGTWPAKTNSLNPLILALFNPINTCLDDDPWNGWK
jgi:hypothetical protein